MAEKQETADDIIAEMLEARTEFPFVYLMGEPDTPEVIDPKTKEIIEPRKINIRRVTVKELADRLKAALRRERGDCAELREALEPWIAFAEWLLENAGKDGLGKAIQENGPIIRQRLEELRDALAAPPRNCNVFSTKDTAREAFQKLRGHRVLADVSLWDDRDEIEAFLDWLFAPYEEGGAK